ncbi:MAG: HAMP domain-containing histidine kinase [Blautia sp.]|nr:HAMP domain-containing histidine kinase [Blautia sp.]
MKKQQLREQNSRLQNYFALLAIVPAVVAIMAYEFLDYMLFLIRPQRTDYDPVTGLGILIPMALMMELITFFFSRYLLRKVGRLTNAINSVASGNFNVTLDEKHAAPLTEVVRDFNKMTQELKSVETLRKDFTNNFSHEFKTPIASINGFAQLLLDTEVSEAERQEYLHIIAEESARLTHLAEQTMMLSRLDSQQEIPDKETFSLDEQLRQTAILLSPSWSEKHIDLDVDIPALSYYGNPSLLSHLWINLLNNAIKFTPENGTISLSACRTGNCLRVSIQDSGCGMDEKQLPHIFHPYYQGSRSHSSNGLGLGLSIAHRIVELCDGSIEVTSALGQGSCFTVILPLEFSGA